MPTPEAVIMALSDLEVRVAAKVGAERAAYAAARRLDSRHPEVGKRTTAVENHVLGVKAELAVARMLGLDWQPHVGTIEGTDVGRDVEVRCRRMREPEQAARATGISAGMLSLNRRDKDKPDKAFVLVHTYASDPEDQLRALGWRIGWDVMQDQYWQQDPDMPDGVYRLPHADLKSIDRLRTFLEFRRDQRHDDRLAAILDAAGTGPADRPRDGRDARG